MTIKLVNTLTNKAYYLENLQENANSTDMFYCFDIQLPEGMVDGEYEYFLYDDGYELVKGLCIIGDFEPNSDTYHNNNSETIVYNG